MHQDRTMSHNIPFIIIIIMLLVNNPHMNQKFYIITTYFLIKVSYHELYHFVYIRAVHPKDGTNKSLF